MPKYTNVEVGAGWLLIPPVAETSRVLVPRIGSDVGIASTNLH